jgi:oligopeptidase B
MSLWSISLNAAACAVAALPALAGDRPPVARTDPKTITIHGETLTDEYGWMRQKGTPEVEAHLKAELAYAEAFMKPTAGLQQKLYEEMLSRIQQTDANVPYRERGYLYYSRTEEGKQYPIYARRKGAADAPEEVILDLNQLAAGKSFLSVRAMKVSPDGQQLAYSTDDSGYRQYTLRVKDLRTGQHGPEAVPRVTAVEWAEDGKTLLYGVEDAQTKRSHQIFRHVAGSDRHELVYEEKDERFSVFVWKTRDRKYLFLETASLSSSEVRFLPADTPAAAPRLIAAREADHEYDADHRDGVLWIRTNDRGRNFRLVTAPATDPARAHWKEAVPHRDAVMLSGVSLFRDFSVLHEREGGLPHLRITDFATGQSHRVAFPEAAYLASSGDNREYDARVFRLTYQSPTSAPSVYDYDPFTRARVLLKQKAVPGYDPSRYAVEVVQARARDGVEVPVWMVYRKDLKKTGGGGNPTLLYAYGSYGSSGAAGFDSDVFSLLDRGLIYAEAYVRGGGELGKKWHDEGRMLKKRNTFTDFIAAAEHLVAAGYTSPDRLAAMGGSAGGLLMGAISNLRPDLFKVVLNYVPFVDVINTMLDASLPLTAAEFEEWGNPKVAEHYRYMRAYSPYDNLEAKAYPTTLVKSSYNDSQVMYWEPAKYVARLRARKTDDNPLLFHINMDPAGHGGKSGRYDKLRETAFDYAFLLWQLGVEKLTS